MKETYEVGPGRTVTITVQVDDAPSTYDPDQAAEVMVENYARARARITELDKDRTTERDRADRLQAELNKRPTFGALRDVTNGKDLALGELQTVRHELSMSREATSQVLNERNRLARRVAELERTVARVEKILEESRELVEFKDKLRADIDDENIKLREKVRELVQGKKARDQLLEDATRRVGAAVELLTAVAVAEARENIVTHRGAVLADAIGNALRVLDPA